MIKMGITIFILGGISSDTFANQVLLLRSRVVKLNFDRLADEVPPSNHGKFWIQLSPECHCWPTCGDPYFKLMIKIPQKVGHHHYLNVVASLACRWWPRIECWPSYTLWFFRGSGPVLLGNPISGGSGVYGSPVPLWINACHNHI